MFRHRRLEPMIAPGNCCGTVSLSISAMVVFCFLLRMCWGSMMDLRLHPCHRTVVEVTMPALAHGHRWWMERPFSGGRVGEGCAVYHVGVTPLHESQMMLRIINPLCFSASLMSFCHFLFEELFWQRFC